MTRLLAASLLLAGSTLLMAATPATTTSTNTATTTTAFAADSTMVRQDLMNALRSLPPEVGMVLKLDPTLFGNHDYLASYPPLAAFIADHPEVAHNPRFFLENVSIRTDYVPDPPNVRIWDRTLETFSMVLMFILSGGVLLWVVKTLADGRRWNRASRAQSETMNKMLDRFGSNDNLLAYLESPRGQKLIDAAAGSMEPGPPALGAPISRIFWSVQVGLVATAVGIGMQLVSLRVPPEINPPVFALGAVLLSLGIGFIVSAVISYVLSRRLGLWPAPKGATD